MDISLALSATEDAERTLIFKGTPSELAELVNDRRDDYGVYVGGLEVIKVNEDARHDNQPALGFTLADKDGRREVGRLVLLDTDTWYEDRPEWALIYMDEQEAIENLAIFTARNERPKVSSIEVDLIVTDDETPELLAEWSAEFGVSFRCVNPHGPGGGAPIYEVSGFTDRVEKWLRDAYSAEDDDVRMYLG